MGESQIAFTLGIGQPRHQRVDFLSLLTVLCVPGLCSLAARL